MNEASLRRCQPGDRVAFYVSRGPSRGYWATATVDQPVFEDHSPLWDDALYPFRISFRPRLVLKHAPVPYETVMGELGRDRLAHQHLRTMIRLTNVEFETIERLIQQAVKSERGARK